MALSLLLIDLLKITKLSNELLLTQFYSFSLLKKIFFSTQQNVVRKRYGSICHVAITKNLFSELYLLV